eukprot:7341990-Prymnesium_polylepis.1
MGFLRRRGELLSCGVAVGQGRSPHTSLPGRPTAHRTPMVVGGGLSVPRFHANGKAKGMASRGLCALGRWR